MFNFLSHQSSHPSIIPPIHKSRVDVNVVKLFRQLSIVHLSGVGVWKKLLQTWTTLISVSQGRIDSFSNWFLIAVFCNPHKKYAIVHLLLSVLLPFRPSDATAFGFLVEISQLAFCSEWDNSSDALLLLLSPFWTGRRWRSVVGITATVRALIHFEVFNQHKDVQKMTVLRHF